MPDKIVLTYFDTTGRAELSRIIMAYGGIQYEDKRLTGEEWQKFKPNSPTGQLPMLEVNGKKICQSFTIAHFLAKRAGLCGKNDVEAAQAEMVVHTIGDIINRFVPVMFENDEAKKAKMMEEFEKDFLPEAVRKVEAMLVQNGGEWFTGSQLTWADVAVADLFHPEGLASRCKNFNMKSVAPKLAAHVEKVNGLPKIKKWLEERPQPKK